MQTLMNIVQIVLSVMLIAVVIMQVRGQGGGLFGAAESSYRTRRGIEKTLFQFTIGLIVVFIFVSIMSVRLVAEVWPFS
jgi:preprotein translocase subunit SecG